jgi:hypothetical protein
MGMTPLALVGGTPHDTDRYSNWLEARLAERVPSPRRAILSGQTPYERGVRPSLAEPDIRKPVAWRCGSGAHQRNQGLPRGIGARRSQGGRPLVPAPDPGDPISGRGRRKPASHFGAGCLADIPHPNFGPSDGDGARKPKFSTTMPCWGYTQLGTARIMGSGGRARPASGSGMERSSPPSTGRRKCSCSATSIASRSSIARRWRRCTTATSSCSTISTVRRTRASATGNGRATPI